MEVENDKQMDFKRFINKFKLKIYWVLAQDMIVYLGFLFSMSDSSQEMTSSLCSILLSY